jgi:hypothetical protein
VDEGVEVKSGLHFGLLSSDEDQKGNDHHQKAAEEESQY